MNNSTLCVTSYPSAVAIYNQINIILNYDLPFLINVLATITLIILTTRKHATATKKQKDHSDADAKTKSTFRTYVDLLIANKELILAPSITMLPQLFSLPQFILSFSLSCQEFKISCILSPHVFTTSALIHTLHFTIYIL